MWCWGLGASKFGSVSATVVLTGGCVFMGGGGAWEKNGVCPLLCSWKSPSVIPDLQDML